MTHPLVVIFVALVTAVLCVVVIRLAWWLLRRQVNWLANAGSSEAPASRY